MNLSISLVPYGQISYMVQPLIKYLQKSEDWTKGRSSVDDIVRFVLTGQMQLWVVFDPETQKIHGYVITEIKQYPQSKMFVIQYCAMEPNHMKYVDEVMHETADRFARDAGCAGVEFFGRPGWEPHVKKRGYTVKTVVFEKFFDEV
jgi:ABC-type molybdate transport system substrate-binding protein